MGAPFPAQICPAETVRTQFSSSRQRSGACLAFLAAALSVAAGGCAWSGKDGTRHVVIIGFGIVSQTNQAGMTVQDVHGLGLVLDDAVNLGFVQRHRVEIDPLRASNAIVSIKASPFSLSVKNFEVRDGVWPSAPRTAMQTKINP